MHGCHTGLRDANIDAAVYGFRDDQRFESDAPYRQGWEDGYRYCYERERMYPRSIGGGAKSN